MLVWRGGRWRHAVRAWAMKMAAWDFHTSVAVGGYLVAGSKASLLSRVWHSLSQRQWLASDTGAFAEVEETAL